MNYEENPFESHLGAQEWISTVENERGTIRDKEINPQLAEWIAKTKPSNILDIGCGQGICSDKLGNKNVQYIGIDPSPTLIARAKELYKTKNTEFIVGNAYNLPLEQSYFDTVFSVTVWFHLENLKLASRELNRVLKSKGAFMIITADPDSYDIWETHYLNIKREGKKIVGSAQVLLNPDEKDEKYAVMSKNTFYTHSLEEITSPLKESGLVVDAVDKIGFLPHNKGRNLFIKILGHKK